MERMEAALKARLIFEKKVGPQVTYVFADEQVREFLYEEISIVRNRRYHLRIAQSIEDLYSKELKSHVNELAFHYLQAGNALKAAEYSIIAGDAAAGIYAIPVAIRHYTNAVELLEEAEPQVRLTILTKLGDAVFHMADHQKSVEYLGTAVGLAKQLGDAKMVADLHRRLAYSHWFTAGNREEALRHCGEGLKATENIGESVEEAALCQQMARIYAMSGEAGPAAKLCHQAIEISKKFDAWEVLAHAYQTLSFCLLPKEKDAIFAYREESLKISTEHNLDDPKCRAYTNLGAYYCYLKGDYKKAEEAYLKSTELSIKLGLRIYEAWNEGELSLHVYFPLGKWDECKRRASRVLETASELGELYVANPSLALAFIHLARGELDEAERLIDKVLPIADRSQWSEIATKCYEATSRLHSRKGNLSKALEMATRADSLASKPSRHNLGLAVEAKFWKIELQLNKGMIDEAERTLKELEDIADQIDETWAASFRFWARGRLESARNNWAIAAEELGTATRTLQEIGRKYDAANAMVDLASSLSRLGKAEEARAKLNEAKDIYRLLQSRPGLERASCLETEIGIGK